MHIPHPGETAGYMLCLIVTNAIELSVFFCFVCRALSGKDGLGIPQHLHQLVILPAKYSFRSMFFAG